MTRSDVDALQDVARYARRIAAERCSTVAGALLEATADALTLPESKPPAVVREPPEAPG